MGCLVRAKGIFNIASGLIIAMLGPVVLHNLAIPLKESGATLPALLRPFFQAPWLVSLLCVPAIAGGVWLCISTRHRTIVVIVSTLFLLAVALIEIWALFATMAPLYGV